MERSGLTQPCPDDLEILVVIEDPDAGFDDADDLASAPVFREIEREVPVSTVVAGHFLRGSGDSDVADNLHRIPVCVASGLQVELDPNELELGLHVEDLHALIVAPIRPEREFFS